MQFLYNVFIQLFVVGFRVAALFNPKAKKGLDGRKQWEKQLKETISPDNHWIWMHCSSLGEFEQGRPVFEALKHKYPTYQFALSFFSPSGYEIRKNYKEADLVFYLPFDTPNNAKKLAKILKPKIWLLAKYDYWYNHLKYQKRNGTQIMVVSAIFRPNQIYFKPYGKWFAQNLKRNIHHFFVQDATSQELLKNIDIKQITIAGDTRFDRVKSIANQTKPLAWVQEFKGSSHLIVVGSSWKEDEDLWLKFINEKLSSGWKVILVPHEIKSNQIKQLQTLIQKRSILYSELSLSSNLQKSTITADINDSKVIIVDAIGFLSQIYASADLAYVGGGFNSSGVHNTLEPTVFGTPTIIGPNYEKFNEVKMLINKGVVFSIQNEEEFEEVVLDLIQHSDKRKAIHTQAKKAFNQQLPSTQIILKNIKL